jgi:uncharacterized protein YqjF (DUF2071 family)
MAELLIRSEDIARRLLDLAGTERRSVEALLDDMLATYQVAKVPQPRSVDIETELQRLRQHIFEEARRYWQSAGDHDKAALTDAQLDDQFYVFDANGIPRLKSETNVEIAPGSGVYHAQAASVAGIRTANPIDTTTQADLLKSEFADELWTQQQNG